MAGLSRRTITGWGASGALHVGACVVAACIGWSLPTELESPQLDSGWLPKEISVKEFDEPVVLAEQSSADPGGQLREAKAIQVDDASATSPQTSVAVRQAAIPLEFVEASWSSGDLLTKIGTPKPFRGMGARVGDAQGGGFFGLSSKTAERIVYVVDNSRSMNYPHDSPAKTRFRRVKMELVNSIWYMEPHQEFYVVFFNSEAVSMPSSKMQPATQAAKERYLEWVATMHADGSPTDPRHAMQLALRLKPDLIYFLTDGQFTRPAEKPMLSIRQDRTVIHTFAFGDDISEAVLTSIAARNGGKFTVIP